MLSATSLSLKVDTGKNGIRVAEGNKAKSGTCLKEAT